MKKSLILRTGLIAIALVAISSVPSANAAANRYITVSSEGTVKVAPDAVRINSTVTLVTSSSKSALSQAGVTSAAVRAALTASAVKAADIATQSITVYPEYSYTQDKGQILLGYRASQSFVIIIKNAANAGAVVDTLVAAGGDNFQLNGVTPFVLDSSKATLAARTVAVKNAKAKALSYVSLLGVKLGKVNYLTENSAPAQYPIMMATAKADSGATTVDLGQQDVTVSISVQWALL